MKKDDPELVIRSDETKFHYRGGEIVGTVIVDSNSDKEALKEAKYLINTPFKPVPLIIILLKKYKKSKDKLMSLE